MDRETLRLISIIVAYICLCAILFGLPFICIEVKSKRMEAQGYEWVEGNCQCHCPSCECDKGHWAPISD